MRRPELLSLALVWALTIAVFWQGLGGQFVWDDFQLIVQNSRLQNPAELGDLLSTGFWNVSSSKAEIAETYSQVYRPLVTLALFVQQQLFGLDARGFHLVSLLLHLLCVTLVFGLLRRMGPASLGGVLGALAGAALFAIHPSRAESVAWISGSTELWMGLLVLSGYAVWIARPAFAIPAAILFGLSLFAKETAIVVPAVLLLDLYAREGRVDWKRWGTATGVFGLFVVLRFALMPPPLGSGLGVEGMPRRVLGSLGHYVEAIFWPWRPVVERGFRFTDCSGALMVPVHTLVLGGLVAGAALFLLFRWRTLRGKAWVNGVSWCLFFLAPVVQILDLNAHALAADRFLYVPMFGLSILLSLALHRTLAASSRWRVPALVCLALLLAACGISTREHVAHFRSSPDLWRYEAERNPSNLYALELVAQQSSSDPSTAVAMFHRGYVLAAANCNSALAARFALLSTQRLVGLIPDTKQERLLELRDFYDGVVETDRLSLGWPEMRLDMTLPVEFAAQLKTDASLFALPHAVVTMRTLDLERALGMVEQILSRDPDHDGAWLLLASIQARMGRFDDAERSIAEAQRRAPNNQAAVEMGRSLGDAKALAANKSDDERVRAIRDAQIQLLLRAPEAARRLLRPQLELYPADPVLVLAYVRAVAADRRFDLAGEALTRAEQLAPEHAEKWQQLRGWLQMRAAPR